MSRSSRPSGPSGGSSGWNTLVILGLVAVLVIMIVGYFFFPFAQFTEQRDSGEEILREQQDAEKALENYRWFRQQYFEIKEQRAQLNNSYEELDRFYATYGEDPNNWDRTTRTTHDRIQQRITGNANQLDSLTTDYNARSADASRAVFKCSLPYRVDERFGVVGPPGSDAPDQPQDETINGSPVSGEPPQAQECDGLPKTAEGS